MINTFWIISFSVLEMMRYIISIKLFSNPIPNTEVHILRNVMSWTAFLAKSISYFLFLLFYFLFLAWEIYYTM